MAKFLCLFALLAIAQTAYSLECYSCDENTCSMDQSKWQKIPGCGKSVPANNMGACLKQVYTDRTTNKEVTLRKCVVADKQNNGDIAFQCSDQKGKVNVCQVCTSDLCNSAHSSVNFSFITLLGVLAAFLIPKYF